MLCDCDLARRLSKSLASMSLDVDTSSVGVSPVWRSCWYAGGRSDVRSSGTLVSSSSMMLSL